MDSDDDYIPATQSQVVETETSLKSVPDCVSDLVKSSDSSSSQDDQASKGKDSGTVETEEPTQSDTKENEPADSISDEHGVLVAWVKNEETSSGEEGKRFVIWQLNADLNLVCLG